MEVFRIFGKIALDSKEYDEQIRNSKGNTEEAARGIEAAFDKVGKVASVAGKAIAAGLAAGTAAISALAKASLSSYADYEQLVGGSQLLFGEAYDYVAEQAANAYSTVQMSQNEYLQQVNGFATGLKTALGGNEKAAAQLAHKVLKAEADIIAATGNTKENIQNAFNGIMKSNFTMLDNLQLGIKPTKEGFQEVIDKVNEWNEANGEATEYMIDNLADCQAALVDYVEMQGLAGYAANEAAGTIQGALSMTKAAWKNLLVGLADGEQDLDVLLSNFTESVVTTAELIVPRLAQIFGGISEALAQIMPVIAEELPGLIEQLLPGVIAGATSLLVGLIEALPSILQIFLEQIPFIFEQIAMALVETFPVLLATVQELFGQIWDYISLELLNTGYSFEEFQTTASTAFSNLWTEVQETWDAVGQPMWDLVIDCICLVRDEFSKVMPEISTFATDAFSDIVDYWENHLQPCLVAIGNFLENTFAPIFEKVFEMRIKGRVETAFNGIKNLWNDTLKPTLIGITDFITSVFTLDWEKAWNSIMNIVIGVMNVIPNAVENMINGAIDVLNGLITGANAIASVIGLPQINLIRKVSISSIPYLEEGGVLEKGQVGFLEGNGAEAVVPLDQNKKWISAVANDIRREFGGVNDIGFGNDNEQIRELKLAFAEFVDALPDMLKDAFESMKFDVNNREFARLVKAVN